MLYSGSRKPPICRYPAVRVAARHGRMPISMEQKRLIPLTYPALDSREELAVLETLRAGALAGDGRFCRLVEAQLRELCGVPHALLTTSCTHALEMAMLTLDLAPGD